MRWVTDELAQRIKVAAAAAANDTQESSSLNDAAVHAPLSQTVRLLPSVVKCVVYRVGQKNCTRLSLL